MLASSLLQYTLQRKKRCNERLLERSKNYSEHVLSVARAGEISSDKVEPPPDVITVVSSEELVPLVTVGSVPDVLSRTTSKRPGEGDRVPDGLELATVVTVGERGPLVLVRGPLDDAPEGHVLSHLDGDGIDGDLENGLVDIGLEVGPGSEGEGTGSVGLKVVGVGDGVVDGDGLAGGDGDEVLLDGEVGLDLRATGSWLLRIGGGRGMLRGNVR